MAAALTTLQQATASLAAPANATAGALGAAASAVAAAAPAAPPQAAPSPSAALYLSYSRRFDNALFHAPPAVPAGGGADADARVVLVRSPSAAARRCTGTSAWSASVETASVGEPDDGAGLLEGAGRSSSKAEPQLEEVWLRSNPLNGS